MGKQNRCFLHVTHIFVPLLLNLHVLQVARENSLIGNIRVLLPHPMCRDLLTRLGIPLPSTCGEEGAIEGRRGEASSKKVSLAISTRYSQDLPFFESPQDIEGFHAVFTKNLRWISWDNASFRNTLF